MQLHSLAVTAFGPFADTQHVDFDALSAGGLFLLHGATGAGKTSILDAVCFGLYGQLPGARAGSRSLHSDHADAAVRPEVVLEATLRGRRFRITRSPLWQRPKQRGAGTTTEQAHVLLEERTVDGWTTLSTRLDETGLEVRRLLGLDVSQFCQVVLLPQGQFAEFLRADADRRRALLESLFDTERFADVERWLVDRRKDAARSLDEADRRLADVLARVAEAGGEDPAASYVADGAAAAPAGSVVGLDPASARGWVAGLQATAADDVRALESASASVVAARTSTTRARHDGLRLQELRQRHAALLLRWERLTAAAGRRTALEATLEAARQAAPVLPLVVEVGRLDTSLALASGDLAHRQQQVVALGLGAAAAADVRAPGRLELLRGESATTRSELGGLAALRPLEDEARELAEAIDRHQRDVVALDQQRSEVERWLATAGARAEALATDVDTALRASERAATGRARVAELRDRWRAAELRDRLDAEIASAEGTLRDAVDEAQRRRGRWLDLRAARLDGMAAELAGRLVSGVPCPVCGADEHPAPSTGAGPAVTREQEARAGRAFEQADASRAEVERRLGATRADRAAAAARAASGSVTGDVEPSALGLRATYEQRRDQQTRDEQSAAGLVDAQLADAAFAAQRAARSADQLRLDEQARSIRVQATAAADRQQALQARLAEARGDDPSVAARSARLAELVDHLDALVEALAAVDRLDQELAAARDRALAAAAARGLSGLDEVRERSLRDDEVARLEEQRRRHDEEVATVSEQLADGALVAAAAAAPPDLPALDAAAVAADTVHTEHVAALAAARARATSLTRLGGRLDDALAARAPVADRHALVDQLSRLAEGRSADNRLRMSLSAYVLTARLEQVAAAASQRLSRMSSGRYTLTHSTGSATARGRGGLHLRVVDSWTGAERDPATLSGGESFAASLALALGLADVVTAEAGGSLLETLFVDEGFGSLDDDTLDEVMGVLDDLREGGRTVGLVSHVADLRQRIPVQLHVGKGRAGSTIDQ